MSGQWVEVEVGGCRIQHRLPAPWTVEKFSNGFACVLNGSGVNWTHMPDKGGATLFNHKMADAVAKKLNETVAA